MMNVIKGRFDDIKIITDKGLVKNLILSNKYEKQLKIVEDQHKRFAKGLKLLDEATTEDKFWDLADTFPEVCDELNEAMKSFMEAYCAAVYERSKKDLT
jgi:endonuclease III